MADSIRSSTAQIAAEGGYPAEIGLLPELIEDLRRTGATAADLEPLFRSAEEHLRMWELAEVRCAALR